MLAGQENKNVVALSADLVESTRVQAFKEKFPERFIEVGVAEQNMATVAAGLGISGKCAFITSYATFSPGRNWEQIRTTICYNNSNVKVIGAHAGISVGPDGATHQALEDLALMRVLPKMIVVVPCDFYEAKKATLAFAKFYGPAYMRFGREKTPVITEEETPFEIGKAEVFWESDKPQVVLVACGSMVYQALVAAKELESEGVGSVVINNHTIKPIDRETLVSYAVKIGRVLTIEEHQTTGGLGGAVAEVLAKECPVKMDFIGIEDQFGQSGSPGELLEHYGLSVARIKQKAKELLV